MTTKKFKVGDTVKAREVGYRDDHLLQLCECHICGVTQWFRVHEAPEEWTCIYCESKERRGEDD